MREIKFRAWDKGFGMMFYPSIKGQFQRMAGEKTHISCGGQNPQGALSYMYESEMPLMQYTGLKDKNGKEIYEGDIIKFELVETGYIEVGEIAWHDSGFWMEHPKGTLHLPAEERREVIGNIYENPELVI